MKKNIKVDNKIPHPTGDQFIDRKEKLVVKVYTFDTNFQKNTNRKVFKPLFKVPGFGIKLKIPRDFSIVNLSKKAYFSKNNCPIENCFIYH